MRQDYPLVCLAQTPRCVTAMFHSKIGKAMIPPQIVGAKDEKAKYRRETGDREAPRKTLRLLPSETRNVGLDIPEMHWPHVPYSTGSSRKDSVQTVDCIIYRTNLLD